MYISKEEHTSPYESYLITLLSYTFLQVQNSLLSEMNEMCKVKLLRTRMHSSRMRTAHSSTVCHSRSIY